MSHFSKRRVAEKAKAEKKSRKAFKTYFDEIKRTGKKTPASALRMTEAPIARLKKRLNVFEQTAADEILAAYQRAAGSPVSRDVDLDVPALAQVRFDAADDHAASQFDMARAYNTWRNDLNGSRILAVAKDLLFAEMSLRAIDAKYRWRKGLARGYLGMALRHFAALRGNTPRGAHSWKLVFNHPQEKPK